MNKKGIIKLTLLLLVVFLISFNYITITEATYNEGRIFGTDRVMAHVGNEIYYIDNSNNLYSVDLGTKVKTFHLSNVKSVETVYGDVIFIIMQDGRLLAKGSNYDYFISSESMDREYTEFVQIMDDVKQVSMTPYTVMVVKNDGTVWGWGYEYRLCIINTEQRKKSEGYVKEPKKLMENVDYVVNKSMERIFFMKDGRKLLYGSLLDYNGLNMTRCTGIEVFADRDIIGVTGSALTLFIDSNYDVYSFGIDVDKDGNRESYLEPKFYKSNVIKIGGISDRYYLTKNGEFYLESDAPISCQDTLKKVSDKTYLVSSNVKDFILSFGKYAYVTNDGEVKSCFSYTSSEGYAEGPLRTPVDYTDVITDVKDGSNTTTETPTVPVPTTPVEVKHNFSSWASSEGLSAIKNNLVPTKLQSNYQSNITREEFSSLVVRLYEEITNKSAKVSSSNPFTDTTSTDVLKAYNLGIINGVGNNLFAPTKLVTRQEMAVMFNRLFEVANIDVDVRPKSLSFTDSYKVSDWAKDSLSILNQLGIINGVGSNEIDPLGNATREQAILLVERTYNLYK